MFEELNFSGILIGIVSFFIIGLFHPIVIKAEYYWGTKCWPLFAVMGIVALGFALFTQSTALSGILGVLGCTFFWSIVELYHQKKRVERGWFPRNPKRK